MEEIMIAKKEKLGINHTPATLFVGVGGIGSDIVRRVAEMCAPGETDSIRFVSMDTNANDLKKVKGSKAVITTIQTSSPQRVLDYLKSDDSARLEWFPNNTTLYPKTVSEGAGQVRAISRLALNATIKTGEINKLYKAIDSLFLKDGGDLKRALRVTLVSSATGGTGSGMALITSMLIREYLARHYPEKSAIVRGFFVLPGVMDTVISTESERESQRRNGYATIKEINAFMVKASGFCGVRKELNRFAGLHIDVPSTSGGVDKLEQLPFDFCFLLDRVDQNQENMQTLEQYKAFAARSLYEQNIGPMQGNAFSVEDNIIKEFADKDNIGRNRFGGIGASALIYPYEDIADYIAYSRAMDRIGSGETVGEWLKYDVKFDQVKKEFKKKRSTTTEEPPKIENVYVSEVNTGESRFDIDIKRSLARNTDDIEDETTSNVFTFLKLFEKEVSDDFEKIPEVANLRIQLAKLRSERTKEEYGEFHKEAMDDLGVIRQYEELVRKQAQSSAKNKANSILQSPAKAGGENLKDYHLEKLLTNFDGAIHPNAMRYMLYLLSGIVETNGVAAESEVTDALQKLALYGQNVDNDFFDVKGRKSPEKEKNIDEVCNYASSAPFTKELADKLNEVFPGYVLSVNNYKTALIHREMYKALGAHLKALNKQFEAFYSSFTTKVALLNRKKEEIIEKLKYRSGNSARYVCGTKDYLDLILERCPEGSEGLLLPSQLNSSIFDAIKANANADRLAQYDSYGDYSKTDVFDDVVLDYFRQAARDDYEEIIDLDIIHALYYEKQLDAFIKANKLRAPGDDVIVPKVSDEEKYAYLSNQIASCRTLASPGVGVAEFNEPRDIKLATFNKKLADLPDINVGQTLETMGLQASASDTVSKYELRFFNALYNITPENLSRFRAPENIISNAKETYEESLERGGIYYKAYRKYIQKIGPDSTKSASISLHIDKRWDSITELPEIDLTSQNEEMIHIHSALIYGIIHKLIKTHPSSRYDSQKRIYAFEDLEGDLHTLIVSNNTECDEFYEVLDALYRDRATVAQIFKMTESLRFFDVESNHKFDESGFCKDLMDLKIGDGHNPPSSLFEIPLTYFNSLPRSKADDNELGIMIDSVIRVLEDEIARFERIDDRAPYLSSTLEDQFRLFIENVKKYQEKNEPLEDNKVVTMVLKKVCNKVKSLGTFNFQDKIDALRAMVKE